MSRLNDTIVMSIIIKKLQNMSRNKSFLISEGIFSALKCVKTYLRSTMGNNQLHALMLVHVHINNPDNINLADVANQFVDRKYSRKQTFIYYSQNYS